MLNYIEQVTADVIEYIHDNFTLDEIRDGLEYRDDFAERLNDECFIADEVTGNASGSYTFSTARARDYVMNDPDAVIEAIEEFCIDAATVGEKFIAQDWEYFDVTARCYCLYSAIDAALDQIEAELTAADEAAAEAVEAGTIPAAN